ncbi:MAG: triose-phosphate isomerase [archaeon]
MKPIVVINLKTYRQGKRAIELARIIEKIDKNILVGVQASDIYEIKRKTKLRVYAQHIDYYSPGRHTGYILAEAVKVDGAKGTFLNHSEHKVSFRVLKRTMRRCKEVGLKTVVFASSLREARRIQRLKPDYLVIEPLELVGGKRSVSKSKPELIEKIAKKIKVKFLVGAGIHDKEDLRIAMKLGASGIAVSSAITKAKNPGVKLREIIRL